LRPSGPGFYDAAGGDAAGLADEDDATGDNAIWGAAMVKRSWTLGDLPATTKSNAAIAGVRIVARIKHDPEAGNIDGSGSGGFFVFYPGLRLNGVDMPLKRTGTNAPHYDAYASGFHTAEFEAPNPPGGGEWTAQAIKDLEFWRYWNWGGGHVTNPRLCKLELKLTYASSPDDVDRTGKFAVTVVDGATGADFTVKNNGTEGAYITVLQIRGRPVLKYNPVTVSVQDDFLIDGDSETPGIGERQESINMDYQPDPNMAFMHARYVLYQRSVQRVRAVAVDFLGNLSEDHMYHALTREIGDRIGLVEEMTAQQAFTDEGSPRGYHIVGEEGSIEPGPVLNMTWFLDPADPQIYWHAGIDGQQEVGITNVVGPM
jgi:hypothetical protein